MLFVPVGGDGLGIAVSSGHAYVPDDEISKVCAF